MIKGLYNAAGGLAGRCMSLRFSRKRRQVGPDFQIQKRGAK